MMSEVNERMDPISEYQKWKLQGEALRTQAKQAMESRFRELLTEAAGIAQEYHRDFGAVLKPPAPITAFRYKAGAPAKKKAKKAAEKQAPAPAAADPKVRELQKRRAQIQKKIEAAKSANKPTRNLEDQLYEIDDELRLVGQAG
jgi:hypothetical protein